MIVSLGDKILFDPGKTQIKKDGAETLKQVTAILKDVQGRDFQVRATRTTPPSGRVAFAPTGISRRRAPSKS